MPPTMATPVTTIALATCRDVRDLAPGDRALMRALHRQGARAEPVIWDEPGNWGAWDAVVIRSCWDYHRKPARFREWLDTLDAAGVVINPPGVIRWNMHKGYLLDAQRAGAAIPPTLIVPQHAALSLHDALAVTDWAGAVVKPAISASSYRTRRIPRSPSPEDEQAFEIMRAEGDVLLQAFVPEVPERGEWSLMFCEGRFTHAVLKVAAPGDFRVQKEWGGRVQDGTPPAGTIDDAARLLAALAAGATYARVDGVVTRNGFVLMELELIEPELFLDRCEPAAERLAGALISAARAASTPRARSNP